MVVVSRRTRRAAVLVACASLAVGLGACGSAGSGSATGDTSSSSQAKPSGGASGKSVYLVSAGDVNAWQKNINHRIMDRLQAKGAKVTYLQDPFDPKVQVQNLNQAIAARPDLILIIADDDKAIIPSLHRAQTAKVPVINLNGRPDAGSNGLFAASLEADNRKLGQYAAENIVEGLQAEGRKTANVIAITGLAATNTVQDRMAGFRQALGKHPQYRLVATEDGNWDQVKSAQLAQQLFAKYRSQGGIQAAYGMADNQAVGIVQAARQAGLPLGVTSNGLIVTGSNCFKMGVDAIKAGDLYGTATQAPVPQGDFTADWVLKYLDGEQLPKTVYAPEDRVTKRNLAQFADVCSWG